MKKILAFTLALALLFSTANVTFAASKEVEALANLKLLLNTTDAEVNADLTRAVGLAMVLKALGYTQEDANAKQVDNKFVDMDKTAWAKGFAALAEELKISNGTSVEPKLFSPNAKLTQKAFVTFMLRALGYNTDEAWAKAGEFAKEAGITETVVETKLTKGEAAVLMFNSLKAKVQGDEKGRTLAQKLVDDKKLDKELAVANGLIDAEPEMLEVLEASTDNLRQLTVKFNGTVDKDSAEKVRNYRLLKTGKTFANAKVLEDGKSVLLTLKDETSFDNKRELKLLVSNVKNADKKEMKKQEVTFTPVDVTYPTVKDITVTGPKNFEISFSEPVKRVANGTTVITVKAGQKPLPTKSVSNSNSDETVVKVELYHSLKDGETYTVAVGNPKGNNSYVFDYANYPNVYVERELAYAADKTAPEATVVKADQHVVVLEFNKPVKGITADHFFHTFTDYKPLGVYKKDDFKDENKVEKGDSVSKVWVRFYNAEGTTVALKGNPLPAGVANFTVSGEAKKVKIVDNWNNEFKTMTYNLDIVADREAPEVIEVEVVGEDTLKVKFNEAVKADKDNFVVTDGSKTVKVKPVVLEDGNKTAKVTLDKSYAGKTLNLTVKGVKDTSLYQNMMTEYSTTVDFSDKTFAGPTKVEYRRYLKSDYSTVTAGTAYDKNTQSAELVVTFDENVVDAATDVKNYGYRLTNDVTGEVKALTETAEFFGNHANVVVITLKDEQIKAIAKAANYDEVNDTVYLVVNQKVTDVNGNAASTFDSVKKVGNYSATGTAIKPDSVKAVAHDKIEFEFESAVDSIDLADFSIHGNAKIKFYTYDFDGSKKVTLYVTDTADTELLPADPTALKLDVKANAGSLDIFGKPIAASSNTLGVKDGIAPSVAALKFDNSVTDDHNTLVDGKTKTADNEGKPVVIVKFEANQKKALVTLKYTEALDKNSISNLTYKVNDGYKFLGFENIDGSVQTLGEANANAGKVVIAVEVTKDLIGASVSENDFKDLTITQALSIKDKHNNVKSSSTDAMPVIVVSQ